MEYMINQKSNPSSLDITMYAIVFTFRKSVPYTHTYYNILHCSIICLFYSTHEILLN